MAQLIAPSVCRYAVNAVYSGQPVVNIIDMQIDTTGGTTPRSEAIFDQAGILINEWDDSVLTHLVPQYTALSVSWLDLNSVTGSTGLRTVTAEKSWPGPGRNASDGGPGHVAVRVNKNITAVRGQRQGRMYLAGVAEGFTSAGLPNEVVPGNITQLNTSFESFLGDINQEQGVGQEFTSKMVVVHTIDQVFTNYSDVLSLTVDKYIGSQVRRLRR